jgi:hypothetical protein
MDGEPQFERAIALFDAANAEDPRTDRAGGEDVPRELLYARRMSEMLARFAPEASETMKLAVRAQHIQRWKSPREGYPMNRVGYLQWRTALYVFHGETAARLMRDAGYDEAAAAAVAAAVGKKGIKENPATQMVEDIAALVFIEHYMLEFAGKKGDYAEEKWIDIIAKTWRKMSPAAHAFALSGKLTLPEALVPLIKKAIAV